MRFAGLCLALFLALPLAALASHTAPENLTIAGGRFTNDTTPTFTWSAVSGATAYEVDLNGGGYVNIGRVTSYTQGTQGDGWYTFSVRAKVTSGANTLASSITYEIDTQGPTVSRLSSTVNGQTATFSVTARPDEAYTRLDGCSLEVDGAAANSTTKKSMTAKSGGDFVQTFTFANAGDYRARAVCDDTDANTTTSNWQTLRIASLPPITVPTPSASHGDRVKLACGANATAADTCHAVYYVADDGLRHLIPTESIYFSWFTSWGGIKTVSASTLAALTLGDNVTYRPGTTLLKFASDDAVYAIARPNVLRHYVTAWLAQSDYGSYWPWYMRVLPDTYFGHYLVGDAIDEPGDYDPGRERAATDEIDDLF